MRREQGLSSVPCGVGVGSQWGGVQKIPVCVRLWCIRVRTCA